VEVSEPHKRQVLGCRLPQPSTVNLLLGRGPRQVEGEA